MRKNKVMNAAVRKLPIGIQSFEDIRNQGFLYVDKTALIYKMATMGTVSYTHLTLPTNSRV